MSGPIEDVAAPSNLGRLATVVQDLAPVADQFDKITLVVRARRRVVWFLVRGDGRCLSPGELELRAW